MSDSAWDGLPKKSPCKSCGSLTYYGLRSMIVKGEFFEECTDCSSFQASSVPDVYLGRTGQKFQNLTDKMGNPIEITSKRHKKEVMDRLGVSEAGDLVNGAPWGSKSWIEGTRNVRKKEFEKLRPMIRETWKRWKETGYARDK